MSATLHFDAISQNTSNVFHTILTAEIHVFSDNIFHVLEILTNCLMINIIGVFGVIGNFINIIVLSKYGFRETTTIILSALSVSDLLMCAVLLMSRLKCVVRHFNDDIAITVNTIVTVFLFFPKYVCLASSIIYVTTIAVERFIAVFLPFTVHKIFKTPITKAYVIVIPVVVIVFLCPTFLTLTYKWEFSSSFNQTIAVVEYTQFYLDHQEFLDFYAWIGLNYFFGIMSTIIILICCISIGFKLFKASVKRELMTSRATGYDVKVVKMLVTVCVVFLAMSVPNLVLYSYFMPSFIFVSPVHDLIDNVCAVLLAINASANFMIYVTMSKKFAVTYKSLFSCARI